MKRNIIEPLHSSFASCERDAENIIKKLFVQCQPYSEELKRLLIINAPDCMDKENEEYAKKVKTMSVKDMIKEGYIRLKPVSKIKEHSPVRNYIIITFEDFTPNKKNPEFRDCTVNIDIVCHVDYWDVGDFAQRPVKIMGYIDGLLNKKKLSGIGTFNFIHAGVLSLDSALSGYTLTYRAIHGTDDNEDKGLLVNA